MAKTVKKQMPVSKAKGGVKAGGKVPIKGQKRSDASGYSKLIFAMMLIGSFAVISPSAAGGVVICMLPTLMLLFKSADGLQSLRAQCVGYVNAGAALPYVGDLYIGDVTLITEIADVEMILFTWGAAAIATLLQLMSPFIAAACLQLAADDRLKKVNEKKEKLVEEWGEEVAPEGASSKSS